jgi:hypothetical protein
MATVSASNFSTNSLVGTTIVRNGFANISLPLTSYVLEGDKQFTVKLRKDSVSGTILVSVPTQTIRDNSAFVSLNANTSSINEDGLVTYTLVMANAANNANLYYSVIPMSANVTQSDFFANTGVITIINNQAVFTVRANVDAGYVDETGEAFRLQLRQNGPTGNIFYTTTANVAIVDTYKLTNYISLIESSNVAAESDIVTFTLTAHNVAPGTIFYYDTVGNVTSSTFSTGNTGSFVMNSTSNVISLTGASDVPVNETKFYQLNIRSGNANGFVAMTSNVVTLVDDSAAFVTATGGTQYINDGYKTHIFTASNNFVISGLGVPSNRNLYYEIVAGGGAGGKGPGAAWHGGGGAGGFLQGNAILNTTGTFAMVVGGGAVGGPGYVLDGRGSNSSILSNTYIGVGGGNGGANGPSPTNGVPGGSGGGGAISSSAGTGITGQGFAGSPGGPSAGAGGGGAGEVGHVFGRTNSGAGGNGRVSVSITNIPAQAQPLYGTPGRGLLGKWFAGGGQGGQGGPTTDNPTSPGSYNIGGGGRAGEPGIAQATPGGINRGGGGGADGQASGESGSGGSGIVIVRYPYTVATYGLIDNVGLTKVVTDNTTITYSLTTINVANTSTLYWTLSGNVANTDVRNGNTGSFTVLNSNATFSVSLANNIVSGNDTKEFTLQLRKNSVNGGIVATAANTITVYAGSTRNNFISATGGTIVDTGSYRLHVFTSSNTLVVSNSGRMGGYVEYLTVAGGGGGGYNNDGYGGGGGGGGLLSGITTVSAQTYVANVGAGATSGTRNSTSFNGSNTSIFGLTSIGGGGGNGTPEGPGRPGGSGGGAQSGGSPATGGSSVAGQGNPGSSMIGNPNGAIGGGGGGGAGGTYPAGIGAGFSGYINSVSDSTGGIGLPFTWVPAQYGQIDPASGSYFAGGGAGGRNLSGFAAGGIGGGGRGAGPGGPSYGASGNVNTGGGGGGGSAGPGGATLTTGGSGIIIIRYPYV